VRSGELCRTPCVVDLPYGRYRLFLSGIGAPRGDSDDVEIAEGLNVYRRAPGSYETPTISNQIGPAAIVALGIVLATAGVVASAMEDSHVAGPAMIGGGIALGIGGGIWTYNASRATRQDGATTFWRQPIP
jgi:hypothetical protein